jgi:hypothetical protein
MFCSEFTVTSTVCQYERLHVAGPRLMKFDEVSCTGTHAVSVRITAMQCKTLHFMKSDGSSPHPHILFLYDLF